jgi:hypothetical protein
MCSYCLMHNPNLGSSLTHIDRLMTFSDVHGRTREVSSSFPHNIQSRILSIHLLPHSITQKVGKENAFIMNYVHRMKAQASPSSDASQNRQLLPSFSCSHPSAETAWSDTRRSGIILVPLIQAPPSQRCFFSTTFFSPPLLIPLLHIDPPFSRPTQPIMAVPSLIMRRRHLASMPIQ